MNLSYSVILYIICVFVTLSWSSSDENSTDSTKYHSSSTLPVLVLGAIHASISIAALVDMMSSPAPNPQRISGTVVPLHYNVYLANDPENELSWGNVHILVQASSPAESFALHAKRLELDQETLVITDEAAQHPIGVKSLIYEAQNEWYVIELLSPLQQDGYYTVSVAFERRQALRNDGLMWSKQTIGNNSRWLVFTQFEPSSARNVFPCFDEPALKARFNISIATPPGMHALSNMPLREATEPVKELPGWVWSHFEESVPMSTYLVAFAVTDFIQVRSEKLSNFSIWVPAGMEQQIQPLANLGPDVIAAMEEFTGVKYQLPKLDNILIPHSSSSFYSGLENWGLITYINSDLSINKMEITSVNIRSTLELMAHEIAHMWFGNLVTPAWWNHLWLKEGFSDYYGFQTISKVLADQHAEEFFVTNNLQPTFRWDNSRTSMHEAAANLYEIENKYTLHSYAKGAIMVRMMEHILTTDVFRAGVSQYLQEYAFQTAAAKDLFGVLDATVKKHPSVTLPVEAGLASVMDPWLTLGGYPLITVTRDYDKGEAKVCQEIYGSAFPDTEKYSWWIPLSYTTQNESDFNNTAPKQWLPANQSCVTISGLPGKDQWVIFNIQQTGYYRVNYDDHNWLLLVNFLKSDKFRTIHVVNRAQLVNDAGNLMKIGLLQTELFQSLIEYLNQETSPTPFKSLLQQFSLCSKLGERSTILERAVALRQEMEEEEGTSHLWYSVIEKACDNPCAPLSCRNNSYEQFLDYKENPVANRIKPDMRHLVLCNAMEDERATEEDVTSLWEIGYNSTVSEEKYDIVNVLLLCATKTELHHRFLALLSTRDSQWIKDETPYAIQYACSRRNSLNGIFRMLEIIKGRDPILMPVVTPVLETLTSLIATISGPDGDMGKVWCSLIVNWASGNNFNDVVMSYL
ncbi:aminopeptidase N [Anabrus simplex]|uniref:aminopeptidase N n=1 Tax=Anabrus simplex TaxID=316456 RepID=UPI0035A28C4A